MAGHAPGLPGDVPLHYLGYLAHVGLSVPLRGLARQTGHAASTFCRAVARVERWREDPLLDRCLTRAEDRLRRGAVADHPAKEIMNMTRTALDNRITDAEIAREARRILRRLGESGAFLALAKGMDTAVVFRTQGDATTRIATCPVTAVEAFRVRDWIAPQGKGRVMRYAITAGGRGALARMLEQDAAAKRAREADPFAAQHHVAGTRAVMEGDAPANLAVNLAESPLALLARRKGRDGKPFLNPEELEAGERLREEFERAQMGPRVGQNWDRFLAPLDGGAGSASDPLAGPQDARDRVQAAFGALGPGLADVAMRCCCFLEGLETAERRLGWSARSGKVVLKIALGRLAQHYGLRRTAPMGL
ncbi:DUF6456 domain-containing protein [Roseobacter sp. HKCCA0434]|uniref:DUF6456 domain-containing protein n=1 Tax=Roseobacter sp. HKCCA0434 TaxID=3079297 RepID=UPI002905BE9A|nr:DUF6456 domain-containing protein [Roseobacter sp. HKCCA0434]